MKTLKQEEVDGRPYRAVARGRRGIGTFIEEIDNRLWLHSALAYQAPDEFEAAFRPTPAGARLVSAGTP
ncbi:MAG TPA: hypothetical protein VF578_00625 [Methylomirabilota bacterium]